jgi:hypothetical protein
VLAKRGLLRIFAAKQYLNYILQILMLLRQDARFPLTSYILTTFSLRLDLFAPAATTRANGDIVEVVTAGEEAPDAIIANQMSVMLLFSCPGF